MRKVRILPILLVFLNRRINKNKKERDVVTLFCLPAESIIKTEEKGKMRKNRRKFSLQFRMPVPLSLKL